MSTAVAAGEVTFGRVVRSEWTKFRSLRSTWWSLVAAVVLALGLGLAAAADAANGSPGSSAADATPREIAETSQFGVTFAQLAVLVLAALFVTSEYGTGMIRSTMTVVPRRVPAVAAKAVVLVAVLFPVMLVTSLLSFVVGNEVWRALDRPTASLTDAGVPAAVLGAPLYLAGGAVVALGVGTLLRNTATSITALVGVFFVVPAIAGGASALRTIAPALPSNAGGALSGQTLTADPLPGWPGLALFSGYATVIALAASVRLRRSDS